MTMHARIDVPKALNTAEPVQVLYPMNQVAIVTSLVMLVMLGTTRAPGIDMIYFGLLLLWFIRMALRLAKQSWHDFRLCSKSAAMSIIAAGWHAALGIAFSVPGATAVAVLILVMLALYGVLCHAR